MAECGGKNRVRKLSVQTPLLFRPATPTSYTLFPSINITLMVQCLQYRCCIDWSSLQVVKLLWPRVLLKFLFRSEYSKASSILKFQYLTFGKVILTKISIEYICIDSAAWAEWIYTVGRNLVGFTILLCLTWIYQKQTVRTVVNVNLESWGGTRRPIDRPKRVPLRGCFLVPVSPLLARYKVVQVPVS